jgi:glutamate synthase domain-containing protein 3
MIYIAEVPQDPLGTASSADYKQAEQAVTLAMRTPYWRFEDEGMQKIVLNGMASFGAHLTGWTWYWVHGYAGYYVGGSAADEEIVVEACCVSLVEGEMVIDAGVELVGEHVEAAVVT